MNANVPYLPRVGRSAVTGGARLFVSSADVIRASECGATGAVLTARQLTSEVAAGASKIMWMPGGVHTISAAKGDEPITLAVRVDRATAQAAQAALDKVKASNRRAFLDFEHREKEASAWVEGFTWEDGSAPGVYASVTWTKAGREAVEGKTFRGFSPAFRVDKFIADASSPALIVGAPLVMGGLTNVPAFEKNAPLWARSTEEDLTAGGAGADTDNNKQTDDMNKEALAALKAKLTELENDVATIKARKTEGESEDAIKARVTELKAKEFEARALRAEVKAGELETDIKARNTKLADDAVKAAVKRGALPAQDEAIQARYRGLIELDPANIVLVEQLPANPALSQAITASGRIEGGQEEPKNVIRAYQTELDPLKRGVIYASGLRKLMTLEEGAEHVIRAANTLGTAAGGIVVQRALDLLKLTFPLLSRISTNFSAENAALGEAITTRLVSVPAVGTYHVDNGYVSQASVATDVPVTIDAHKFCQVEFNANEIASTRRLLFGENEESMHYALGKELIDTIYALFVAETYTETATKQALVDFSRATVIQMGVDMNTTSAGRNANTGTRSLLLSSAYHGKLAEDITVISPLYNTQGGGTVGTGVLPMVHGFLPIEAPNLPTTGNLVGVGLRADAVAMAVRPANDYTDAQPGLPATGVVQQVTNPDTGITVTLTRFVNHQLGKSYMRIAWMRGAAKGNVKAGQLLLSS